jgi:hypothetical protein
VLLVQLHIPDTDIASHSVKKGGSDEVTYFVDENTGLAYDSIKAFHLWVESKYRANRRKCQNPPKTKDCPICHGTLRLNAVPGRFSDRQPVYDHGSTVQMSLDPFLDNPEIVVSKVNPCRYEELVGKDNNNNFS